MNFYRIVGLAYYGAATIVLMLLAVFLLGNAVWSVVTSFGTENTVTVALDSAGLLIIGFAIVETAQFIAEEELIRKRELRSATESRRSITKFITIIVIAASLEALVMVFKTSLTNVEHTIYPASLLIAAMIALVSLGAYQYLSSRIDERNERNQTDAPSVGGTP